MRVIKFLLKFLVGCVLVAAIVIGSIAFYMKYYGKNILQETLSEMLGTNIRLKSVSFDLDEYKINFRGFSVFSDVNFDEKLFNAEKFTLLIDKEKFDKEKKIVFEELLIKKGVLNIERTRSGAFRLAHSRPQRFRYEGGAAYADEPPRITKSASPARPAQDVSPAGGSGLRALPRTLKKITIEDSVINFKDYYISLPPLIVRFDNFNMDVTTQEGVVSSYGDMLAGFQWKINFNIASRRYGNGNVFLKANTALYKDRVDMEMFVDARRIDVMQFLPYLTRYTPFSFNSGVFDGTMNFNMHNRNIDSLTTLTFQNLSFAVQPGKKNASFLATSINKLVPYLSSGAGEIVFDFVIKGPAENPEVGLGPQVKFAIGMVVVEELGNLLQQLQQLQK